MQESHEDQKDLFMDFVAGKYKISNGLSTAKFWGAQVTDKDDGKGVPRPDINIGWLTVAAFFSLDHLYLRSPETGFLKVITLGGLGLWWLWDLVQLFGERDRVLKYGMSAPFDFWNGIGQGMIYDGSKLGDREAKWQYTQQTSMGVWMMTLLIGFTGADWIYLGKTWQGLRRLFYFVVALSFMSGIIVSLNKGIDGDGLVGFIISLTFFLIITLPVFGIWGSNIYEFLKDPTEVFNDGLKTPEVVVSLLGWPQRLFVDSYGIEGSPEWFRLKEKDGGSVDPDDRKNAEASYKRWLHIRKYFMIDKNGITPDDFREKFKINRKEKEKKENENKDKKKEEQRGGADGDEDQNEDEVAGVPPIDLAWQGGEIIYNTVSSITYSILDAIAMTTPWGAAAKTAQLALKAAAKQGGIKLPDALAKGNPMAALRGIASQGKGLVGDIASKGISGAVGNAIKKVGAEVSQQAIKGISGAVPGIDVSQIASKGISGAVGNAVKKVGAEVSQVGVKGISQAVGNAVQKVGAEVSQIASKGISVEKAIQPPPPPATQKGGSNEPLSLEAQILGASVIALISGGSLKALVDFLVAE